MTLPTILIVDDDLEMRAMLRDVLVRSGFRVEEAASSDELLALAPRVEPAVIILDHEMPGDWGLEVLPTLRKTHPEAAVVFTTAFGGPTMWETATRAGAAACLSKPFRVGDLLATVRRVLAADSLDCDRSAS
jgi:FixJ family two-component response regulator